MDFHPRRIMMPLEGLHQEEEVHRRTTIIVVLPMVPIGKGEDEVDLREEDHVAVIVAEAEAVVAVPTTTTK